MPEIVLRNVLCAFLVVSCGCLYKSGGKYVGTLGVASAEISPAEPTPADDVTLSLTVQFAGTTTSTAPSATVKVTLDDGEPKMVTVALTPQAGTPGAGVAVGDAKVDLGKLPPGEHAVAVVAAAPPGLVGAVLQPLVRKVTVKAAEPQP